jgi:hypothetical protein
VGAEFWFVMRSKVRGQGVVAVEVDVAGLACL